MGKQNSWVSAPAGSKTGYLNNVLLYHGANTLLSHEKMRYTLNVVWGG